MVKNVSATLALDKAFAETPSKPKQVARINSQNQCYAKTQKGLRCKRKTRIGNNFCFQHLPK